MTAKQLHFATALLGLATETAASPEANVHQGGTPRLPGTVARIPGQAAPRRAARGAHRHAEGWAYPWKIYDIFTHIVEPAVCR